MNVSIGDIWRGRKQPPEMIEKRLAGIRKRIDQLSLDSQFLRTWPSVKEAGNTLNIATTGITLALKGRIKSSGGFKWRYTPQAVQENQLTTESLEAQ